jgi:amidase
VWPLSQSLDTIGPMATSVANLVAGMALLEPGFTTALAAATVVGRLRIAGADPAIDAAIDRALAQAELEVIDIELAGWAATDQTFLVLIASEAWNNDKHLLEDRANISDKIAERVAVGESFVAMHADALTAQDAWRDEVEAAFARVQVLALPTLLGFTMNYDATDGYNLTALTSPFNVSGSPALSLPVPADGSAIPASLQLVGPLNGEELLCATASVVEAAVS